MRICTVPQQAVCRQLCRAPPGVLYVVPSWVLCTVPPWVLYVVQNHPSDLPSPCQYARNGEPEASCAAAAATYPTDIETTCLGSRGSHWGPCAVSVVWESRCCRGVYFLPPQFNRFHWVTVTPGVLYLNSTFLFFFKQFLNLKQTSQTYQWTNGNIFSGRPPSYFSRSACKNSVPTDHLNLHFSKLV